MLPLGRAFCLTKTIENVRQEFIIYSFSSVTHNDDNAGVFTFEPHRDLPSFRSKLDRITQLIPSDLLQAHAISRDQPGALLQLEVQDDPLGISSRTNGLSGCLNHTK